MFRVGCDERFKRFLRIHPKFHRRLALTDAKESLFLQSDLIISGGYNIYPKEIELLLDEQPGVLESAVIGVPHPDFGEGVVAVLVAAPGQSIDADAIRSVASDRLAKFKQPKVIEVVPELPRNTMGKVQKNLLRDQFAGVFTG